MPRVTRILSAADQRPDPVDTLILPHAQRQASKGFVFGVKGTCVEFDFPEPVLLRTDDALMLEDGRVVEVVAEPEPLIEVRSADVAALARLAWRLGDRHMPIQALERRIRLKRDGTVEALLEGWGVKFTAIEAPFEPEGGAYAAANSGHHHHDHAHHHAHDHAHEGAHGHAHHDRSQAHDHHHHGHEHHDHGHEHRGHSHDHPHGGHDHKHD